MATDPRVTKHRVTMTNYSVGNDAEGRVIVVPNIAMDFVRPDFLDAYVEDARKTWTDVEVSAEPDAGPGGYDGATYVPEQLDHPLAGEYFPATNDTEGL